ncbi:MAG TPA: GNAT family N-acetyltransferase [Flavisolibacter sp.]|jgi:predicted N-acetyltransferase YhbS|nr:GNAT family N-acetyltransferase [Flavisolibacter sp.]
MNIRRATIADIPALKKLVNGAYRGEGSKKGWTTEADLLDGIRTSEAALNEMLETPNALILAADDGKNLQGCVYLEKQTDALYLGMLTVEPALQGKGLGAALMMAAEESAKSLGCKKIQMTVITVRDSLIAYYNRKGYADTGERKAFPTDPKFGIAKQPLEFMVMEKMLI